MIKIFYVDELNKIPTVRLNAMLKGFPVSIQLELSKYKHHNSLIQTIVGKKLLEHSLYTYGYPGSKLQELKRTKYNKPYIEKCFHFNISHSENSVIIATSDLLNVGIDIEELRDIDIDVFKDYLNPEEYSEILSSKSKVYAFFNLWTKKESILKASGEGLNIPLKDVKITREKAILTDKIWHVKKIVVSEKSIAHLATCTLLTDRKISIEQLRFS